MKRSILFLVTFALLSAPTWLHAELKLAKLFTDHLVLQQELPIAVWGFADLAAEVTVETASRILCR
jgi:sialate O-acetylesterase